MPSGVRLCCSSPISIVDFLGASEAIRARLIAPQNHPSGMRLGKVWELPSLARVAVVKAPVKR